MVFSMKNCTIKSGGLYPYEKNCIYSRFRDGGRAGIHSRDGTVYGGAGYPDFMNGYWDENLNWHEGRYWPQYFELMDLLNMPELKLPDLETSTKYKNANLI